MQLLEGSYLTRIYIYINTCRAALSIPIDVRNNNNRWALPRTGCYSLMAVSRTHFILCKCNVSIFTSISDVYLLAWPPSAKTITYHLQSASSSLNLFAALNPKIKYLCKFFWSWARLRRKHNHTSGIFHSTLLFFPSRAHNKSTPVAIPAICKHTSMRARRGERNVYAHTAKVVKRCVF